MSVAPARSSLLAVRTDDAPVNKWGTRSSFCNGCPSSPSGKAGLRGVHGPQADQGDFF